VAALDRNRVGIIVVNRRISANGLEVRREHFEIGNRHAFNGEMSKITRISGSCRR